MFGFNAFAETPIADQGDQQQLQIVVTNVGAIGASAIGVNAIGRATDVTEGAVVVSDANAEIALPSLTATAATVITAVTANAAVNITAPNLTTIAPNVFATTGVITEVQIATISSTSLTASAGGDAFIALNPGVARATFVVTVQNEGYGNKYYVNGVSQAALSLHEEGVYRFDVSDSSVGGHPFNFSETSNGTHNGGAAYTTGVTVVGAAGQPGAYVEIVVTEDTPDLYYYCGFHSGMGGGITFVTDYSQVPFAIQVSSLVPQVNFSALVEVQAAAVSLTPAEASAAGAAEAVFAELIEVGLTPFDVSVTATATVDVVPFTQLQLFTPAITLTAEANASVNAPIAQVVSPNVLAGFTATALANLPTIIFEPLTLQSTEYCESETTSNAVITTCEIPRFNNVVLDRIPGRYDGGRSAPYYIFNENSSVAPLFWAVDWRTFTFFGIYSDFGSGRTQRINNVVTYPNSDDITIQVHRIAPDGTVGPVQRFDATVNTSLTSGTSRVLIPSKRLFILGNSAKEYPYRESALNNYSTLAHQIYVPYVISDDVSFKGLGHYTLNWVDGDGGSQDGTFFTNVDANFGVYAPDAFAGYLGATFNDVFYFRGHYTPNTRSATEFNDKIHALWLFQYNGLYKVTLHFGFPDNNDSEEVELYSSSSLSSAQAFFNNAKDNDIVYTQDPSSEVFSFYGADDSYIEAAQQQEATIFDPIVSQAVAISDVLSVSLTAAEAQAAIIYDRTGFGELPTISVQALETSAFVEGVATAELPTLSAVTPQANTTLTALTGTLNFSNLRVFTPTVYETVVEIPLPTPVIQVSPPLASTNTDANVSSGIASLALLAPEPQVDTDGNANPEASILTITAPAAGTNTTADASPLGATINAIAPQPTASFDFAIAASIGVLETTAPEPQAAYDYKVSVDIGASLVASSLAAAVSAENSVSANLPQLGIQPPDVDIDVDSSVSVAVGSLTTVSPEINVAFDYSVTAAGSQVTITSPAGSAQISVEASIADLLELNTQPPSNAVEIISNVDVNLPQIVVSPPATLVSISVTASNQQTSPITVTAPSVSISTEAGVIAPVLTIIENSIGVGVGFTTIVEPFAIRSASLSPPEVDATGGALAESALPALFTSPVRAQTSVGEIPEALNIIFISPLEGEANGTFSATAAAGFTENLVVSSITAEALETRDAVARPTGAAITTVLPVFQVRGSANAEPIDLADSPILFPGDDPVDAIVASGDANTDPSVGENIVINSVAGKGQIDNLAEIEQVKLLFTSAPQVSETADANAENRIQSNPSVTTPNVSTSGDANADDNLAPGGDNFTPRTTAPEVSVIINVVADDDIKIQHLETIVNRRPAVVNVTPDLTEVVTLDRSFDVTGQVPGVSNGGYLCGDGNDSSALANQYYFRVEHTSVPGTGTTLNSQDRGRLRVTLFRTQWDAVTNSFTGYEVDFLEDHTGNFYDYGVVTTQPAWYDHGDRCTALVMYKYRSSSFDTVTRYGIRKWEINYANDSIRYLGESTAGVRNYNSDGSEYGTSNTVYSAGYRGDVSDLRGKTYAYVKATNTTSAYRFIALASNLTLTNTTNPGTRPSSGDADYPTTWLNVRPDDYDQSAFRFIIIDKEVQLQALGLNIWTPLPKPQQDAFVEASVDRLTEVVSLRARGAEDRSVEVQLPTLTVEQTLAAGVGITEFPEPFQKPLDIIASQGRRIISSNLSNLEFIEPEIRAPVALAQGGTSAAAVEPLTIVPRLPTVGVSIDVFTVLAADPISAQNPEVLAVGDANVNTAEFGPNQLTITSTPEADAVISVEINDLPTIFINPDGAKLSALADTGLLVATPVSTPDATAREQLTVEVITAEPELSVSVETEVSVEYSLNLITPEVFAFQAQAIPDFVVLVANEVRFIEVAEELRTSVVEPETRIIEVA